MSAFLRSRGGAWTVIGLIWSSLVPLARAEVTFYLQREGAPDDGGLERFQAAAAPLVVQDYEDPLRPGPGLTIPGSTPDSDLLVAVRGNWGDGYFDPVIASSPEFNAVGRFFNNAVVAGVNLRVEAPLNEPLHAVGMWIFDDGRDADSVYLVTVTEANGSVRSTVLANEIPLDAKYHEIEGFVGAVSDVGITVVDVLAVDPVTLAPHFDFFEVDHVMVALMPPPVSPPETGDVSTPDETSDSDNSGDSVDDAGPQTPPQSNKRCCHTATPRTPCAKKVAAPPKPCVKAVNKKPQPTPDRRACDQRRR